MLWWLVAMLLASAGTSAQGDAADVPAIEVASEAGRCLGAVKADFAFTSSATGNSEVWLYEADSGAVRPLTDDPAQDHWASWSPDGKRIAFQSLRDGNREIYVMSADGSDPVDVSRNPEQDLLPAWSPDGSRIAFFSSRERPWNGDGPLEGDLFVMDADGAEPTRLTTQSLTTTTAAAWSHDGSRLAFGRVVDGESDIWVLRVAAPGEPTRLTGAPGFESDPSFSPDDSQLAFSRETDAGATIVIVRVADGRESTPVSRPGFHYGPRFSPDGSALLYSSSHAGGANEIWCVAADGSYDVPVIVGTSDARSPAWRAVRP